MGWNAERTGCGGGVIAVYVSVCIGNVLAGAKLAIGISNV